MMESLAKEIKTRHALRLLSNLDALRRAQWSCNFHIKAGDALIPVHGTIIAGCSSVISHKILEPSGEQGNIIEFENVRENAAEQCVQFMYTGEAKLIPENVVEVLNTAAELGLDNLIELCKNSFLQCTSIKNCFQIKNLCKKYNLHEKEKVVMKFIKENFNAMRMHDDIVQLEKAEISDCLSTSGFNHEIIWKVIAKWIGHKRQERKHLCCEILSPHLQKFSPNFIINEMLENELVSESDQLSNVLVSTIFSDLPGFRSAFTCDNCISLSCLCEVFQHPNSLEAQNLIREFMAVNFDLLSEGQRLCDISNLSKEAIFYLLRSPETKCVSEKKKWGVALRWAKHSKEHVASFPELLKSIVLENLPTDFIHNVVSNEPLVKESSECLRQVNRALYAHTKIASPPAKKVHKMSDNSSSNSLIFGSQRTHEASPQKGHSTQIFAAAYQKESPLKRKIPTGSILTASHNRSYIDLESQDPESEEEGRPCIAIHQKNSGQIYSIDLKDKKWSPLSKTTIATDDFQAIVNFDENLHTMKGRVLKCRTPKKVWHKMKEPLENPGPNAKMITFQKHIYIVETKKFSIYDQISDTWEHRTAKEITDSHFCVAATDDHLYILGGELIPKRAICYDPVVREIFEISSMIHPRKNAAATSMSGKIYVMGGINDNMETAKTFEFYNPNTDQWTGLSSMLHSRWGFCACVFENKIYAIGGQKPSGSSDNVEVYDDINFPKKWSLFKRIRKLDTMFTACVMKT